MSSKRALAQEIAEINRQVYAASDKVVRELQREAMWKTSWVIAAPIKPIKQKQKLSDETIGAIFGSIAFIVFTLVAVLLSTPGIGPGL